VGYECSWDATGMAKTLGGINSYLEEFMYSLRDDFFEDLRLGRYLVVMPISRFVLEEKFTLGKFSFYPAGEIDVEELRVVPNKTMEMLDSGIGIIVAEGQDLRELKSSASGICADVFCTNVCVAFTADIEWDDFLQGTHETDILLINTLSQDVEKAMDLIRFYFCRFDLPDTLPGQVGTWQGSNGFSGALLYNLFDNESYVIGGSVVTHFTVKGSGLELAGSQTLSIENHPLMGNNIGEVGNIARMALNLNSGVFEANNITTKFIRAMNLLEFLAYPDEYKKFELVKKEISCHIAATNQQYHKLLDRFYELTGKKDDITGEIIGYRTRIVHIGTTLEEILVNEKDRNDLLLELQGYICSVIEDMIENMDKTWEDFLKYRNQLKINLGLKD